MSLQATSLKDFRELDDSAVWVLRGAGSERNQPRFMPGTYGAQLAGMIWNTIHLHAAKYRAYPFSIEMTDFVVLCLCTGSFFMLRRSLRALVGFGSTRGVRWCLMI